MNGVDLSLSEGELTVLLGPSGGGKSTFLNILEGLDHATDGQIADVGAPDLIGSIHPQSALNVRVNIVPLGSLAGVRL